MSPNLVQAEFFHCGRNAESLEELVSELAQRVAEGSHIKTVVRINDAEGCITTLVLQIDKADKAYTTFRSALVKSSGVKMIVLSFLCRIWARRISALRRSKKSIVLKQLARSVRSHHIAVERSDRSFRLACVNELHELTESAKKSVGLWLIVFKPNDLLADKNVVIAGCF